MKRFLTLLFLGFIFQTVTAQSDVPTSYSANGKVYSSVEEYNLVTECANLTAQKAEIERKQKALEFRKTTYAKGKYATNFKAFQEGAAQLDYQKALAIAEIQRKFDLEKAKLAVSFNVEWQVPQVSALKCE